MSFTVAAIVVMVMVPTLTSAIVFGIPALVKFLREQDQSTVPQRRF